MSKADFQIRPLSEEEIDAKCEALFLEWWNGPASKGVRFLLTKDQAEALYGLGFSEGGAYASEHGGNCLEILLVAAERCLAHFDRIRPEHLQPSAMVEQLRKAVNDSRCKGEAVANG